MFARALTRQNPFWDEMEQLQRGLRRILDEGRPARAAGIPPINMWSDEQGAKLTAELPGMKIEDLDISVLGNSLTLKGERKADEPATATWHRRERGFGNFTRTFELPFRIAADKVEATLTDGILRLSLPRMEEDKPRRIAVKGV